jgi:hypothetical protein
VIEDGADLIFEEGAKIVVEGDAKITGKIIDSRVKIQFSDNATLTLSENSVLSLQKITGYSMVLGNRSLINVSGSANLVLNQNVSSTFGTGSGITVLTKGNLSASSAIFTSVSSWRGICAKDTSTVSLTTCRFDYAETAFEAIAADVNINSCSFRYCVNGISLINCSNAVVINNVLSGNGNGAGISLTQTPIVVSDNRISGFMHGMSIVSCDRLTLIKNIITSNTAYGLYITGYNSLPLLVNTRGQLNELNNEIYGNGLGMTTETGGQIYMKYSAGISMSRGHNNVYSVEGEYHPVHPCLRGASYLVSTKADLPSRVYIKAENNYWGCDQIEAGSYESFFDMWRPNERYFLDVDPYGTEAYTIAAKYVKPSGNEPAAPESKLLYTAVKQEQSGNYTASIKLYEQIIKKYEDKHEYYVAMTRLPYLYSETGVSTEPILSSYEEASESEDTANRKFFKEMQVSTHLKNSNYDRAISIAEQLKAAAQSEDEVLLAEIDIEIANMMKSSKSKRTSSSDEFKRLISELNGTKGGNPAVANEATVLPNENILYQNYPNPFNPITQIKFALKKTADVKLTVYNIAGQKVAELANGTRSAGYHPVNFDGSRFNSGVYYYSLEVEGKNITKKMLLTK